MTERTAKRYIQLVKKFFKEDRIAIEDMVSESYIAMVKQHHSQNDSVCALRCFSTWIQSHESLPEVALDSAKLYHSEPEKS